MKCKNCKTELFDIDIVKWKSDKGMSTPAGIMIPYKYRCPKCFNVTKVDK